MTEHQNYHRYIGRRHYDGGLVERKVPILQDIEDFLPWKSEVIVHLELQELPPDQEVIFINACLTQDVREKLPRGRISSTQEFMAKIEVLHRRASSIETATPEDPKGGAALNISSPDTPISAPDAPTSAYSTTTTMSPESSNTMQPAARAKKITCRRCKKQLESGNKLHKHLKEDCKYTRQQQETRPNTTAISRASPEALRATQSTAISKASPYQTTSLSLDQIQFDLQENPWANDYGSNDAPASN
jgi:hypothetical protein